jgi:hypothetical protein
LWQVEEDVIVTDITEDVSSDKEEDLVSKYEVSLQGNAEQANSEATSSFLDEIGLSGKPEQQVINLDAVKTGTSLLTSDTTLQIKTEQPGKWLYKIFFFLGHLVIQCSMVAMVTIIHGMNSVNRKLNRED